MAARRKTPTLADPFKLTMLIFAVIAFMYFTGEVLRPLALSVLLSFALVPAVRRLERRGLPRAPAVVLTVVVALGLLGGIGFLVGQQLTALANRLPDYQENVEKKLSGVFKPGQQSAGSRLKDMADRVTAKLEEAPATATGVAAPIPKVEVVQQPSFQERLRWLACVSLGPGSAVGASPSAPVVGSRDFWWVSLATQPTIPSGTRGARSDEVIIPWS